jgi:hypothetical protein
MVVGAILGLVGDLSTASHTVRIAVGGVSLGMIIVGGFLRLGSARRQAD